MVGWRLFNRIDGDSPPTTLRAEMDLRDVDTDVVQTVSDVSCERRVPSRASRRANAPANQGLTRCVKILIARDAKNRFPRGVKCTHLAGPAVSAARAAMGVAMADMCVAIETVDGCLSTTDSAAGDGSKTSDESTQQLARQLDWIRFWRQSIFIRRGRSPRVGSFFRMRGSIVRR